MGLEVVVYQSAPQPSCRPPFRPPSVSTHRISFSLCHIFHCSFARHHVTLFCMSPHTMVPASSAAGLPAQLLCDENTAPKVFSERSVPASWLGCPISAFLYVKLASVEKQARSSCRLSSSCPLFDGPSMSRSFSRDEVKRTQRDSLNILKAPDPFHPQPFPFRHPNEALAQDYAPGDPSKAAVRALPLSLVLAVDDAWSGLARGKDEELGDLDVLGPEGDPGDLLGDVGGDDFWWTGGRATGVHGETGRGEKD